MNFAAMCLSMNEPGSLGIGVKALKALYVSGVGYDFYHALTAAICVFVIGTPMVNKIRANQDKIRNIQIEDGKRYGTGFFKETKE